MAETFKTLAEMLKINAAGVSDVEVSDILNDAPLLRALAAVEPSDGTNHRYTKETTAAIAAFRAVNAGLEQGTSVDTSVTVALAILDSSFLVDKALADKYRDGPEAYIAREARRHLRSAFFAAEQQILYGTDNDATGFAAIADSTSYDDSNDSMVVNAGGSTASTGSSAFFIRTNDLGTDVALVMDDETGLRISPSVVQQATEVGETTKHFPAYYTPVEGWLALQLGSAYSVGRICNLTEDTGKGMSDDLAYEMLAKFPSSRQPNIIAMNRRSLEQLRASRTATNAVGTPAPRPTEIEGIQIIPTDAISNTESLLTAASTA